MAELQLRMCYEFIKGHFFLQRRPLREEMRESPTPFENNGPNPNYNLWVIPSSVPKGRSPCMNHCSPPYPFKEQSLHHKVISEFREQPKH